MRLSAPLATLGVGLLLAGAGGLWAAQSPPADQTSADVFAPVVTGTVHQALFALSFDGQRGVAVGAAGEVQLTEDQGRSWALLEPAPTRLALLGVDLAGDRIIAVGQQGLIVTRSAEGQWRNADSTTKNRLFSVSLNPAGRAVVVGAFGTVLVSEDSGTTWASVAPAWADYAVDGMEPHLYATHIDAEGVITIAGEFGLILRSRNSGQDWELLHKGDASLFALQLRDDGVGYAAGQSGTVLRSADGGASWTALQTDSEALLLSVHGDGSGTVVASAMRDMVYSKDHGQSWQRVPAPQVLNAWYADLEQAGDEGAAASADLLAVGQAGQIVKIDP